MRKVYRVHNSEKKRDMKEKILVINGATREGGNTDVIVKKFVGGVQTAGLNVQSATLRELDISDCIGCCKCLKESNCNFDDDMTHLRDAIVKSDILVFASPLYFCEVTGLMKNFLDRLYFFYHPVNKHLVSGKKVLIITTLGEKEVGHETVVLEEFYKQFLHALDLTLLDMVYFPDLMEKEAIQQKPEYLEKIFNIGKNYWT